MSIKFKEQPATQIPGDSPRRCFYATEASMYVWGQTGAPLEAAPTQFEILYLDGDQECALRWHVAKNAFLNASLDMGRCWGPLVQADAVYQRRRSVVPAEVLATLEMGAASLPPAIGAQLLQLVSNWRLQAAA